MTADVVSKPATASHSYTPRATDIAMTAMSLIGTPYRYGGNSPLTGLDCSGFVKYVYKETLNTNLPRTAAEMSRVGQPVSRDELKPGDLVFYNTMRRSNSHVGIYLGDGRFIHSPRTGQRVRINSMDESYWRGRFNGARRIIGGEGVDRAKVLQQYSREADTTPDTYNYDEPDDPGEPPRERSVSRHHTERTLVDTRKPADDAIVQETVAQEPSHNGDQEVSHERRSRHRGVRHQERASRHHHDAAKETVRDNGSRRYKEAKHSGKEENRRHKESRHGNVDRDHKSTREAHHRGNDRDLNTRRIKDSRHHEAKADKRDVRNPRRERTSDRHHTEKAKAVKSIERKAASKEKTRRRR